MQPKHERSTQSKAVTSRFKSLSPVSAVWPPRPKCRACDHDARHPPPPCPHDLMSDVVNQQQSIAPAIRSTPNTRSRLADIISVKHASKQQNRGQTPVLTILSFVMVWYVEACFVPGRKKKKGRTVFRYDAVPRLAQMAANNSPCRNASMENIKLMKNQTSPKS
jgi:hypothetical protein